MTDPAPGRPVWCASGHFKCPEGPRPGAACDALSSQPEEFWAPALRRADTHVRLKRRRSARWLRETWRAKRRDAFVRAWRFNLLSAGLLAGCVLGIIFTGGSDAIWARSS